MKKEEIIKLVRDLENQNGELIKVNVLAKDINLSGVVLVESLLDGRLKFLHESTDSVIYVQADDITHIEKIN
jgi:hypothetical protein